MKELQIESISVCCKRRASHFVNLSLLILDTRAEGLDFSKELDAKHEQVGDLELQLVDINQRQFELLVLSFKFANKSIQSVDLAIENSVLFTQNVDFLELLFKLKALLLPLLDFFILALQHDSQSFDFSSQKRNLRLPIG